MNVLQAIKSLELLHPAPINAATFGCAESPLVSCFFDVGNSKFRIGDCYVDVEPPTLYTLKVKANANLGFRLSLGRRRRAG